MKNLLISNKGQGREKLNKGLSIEINGRLATLLWGQKYSSLYGEPTRNFLFILLVLNLSDDYLL